MRSFTPIALALAAAASLWFLAIYGKEVAWCSEACGGFQIAMLDEVSVWFYRERDASGRPASPYRLHRHLSVIDPLDGPNWEIRIPGWVPGSVALVTLAFTGFAFSGKSRRYDF